MQTVQEKLDAISDGVATARAKLRLAEKLDTKLAAEKADLASLPAECKEGTTLANTKARIEARIKKLTQEREEAVKSAEDFANLHTAKASAPKPDNEGDRAGDNESTGQPGDLNGGE